MSTNNKQSVLTDEELTQAMYEVAGVYVEGGEYHCRRADMPRIARNILSRYAAPQASAEADLDLYRQWFDSVQDTNPQYLTPKDYQAAQRLYERLGMRMPNTVLKSPPAAEDSAKGAGDVALPPCDDMACVGGVAQAIYTADTVVAAVLADRQQRGGEHFRDATKMASTEDLHITHRPLIREAVALLRLRQPATPDFERVASELEFALDGLPTPAGAPSQELLEAAALAAQNPVEGDAQQRRKDQRCLEIGRAAERAAEILPDGYEIRIDIERGAGTVHLIHPDGSEHYVDNHDTFSDDINQAIDAAIAQQGKEE